MPDRPTGQQLIGMTSNEILDIFGGASDEKYGQYIPGYNRTKESNARTDTQFSLKNILYESEQAQSKSGFAGGGAAGKASGEAREGTLQGFQKQLEGFYSDYESEVYGALAHLADLEAFSGSRYGPGTPAPWEQYGMTEQQWNDWQASGGDDSDLNTYGGDETLQCFIGSTKILMFDGSVKNIEDINQFDLITSFDESTKEYVQGVVTKHLIHPINKIVNVANINGLIGTPTHPIYVDNKWIEIAENSDTHYCLKYVTNYFNLEVDGFSIDGYHNYIANDNIVSGLGDNLILNNYFKRQKNFQKQERKLCLEISI